MKRNRVLKNLFILATPSIISIASLSCSTPTKSPQKDGDSQGNTVSQITPPTQTQPPNQQRKPDPTPQPKPETPPKENSKPNEGNGSPNLGTGTGTGTTPILSESFKQLKAEIKKLSLYNDQYTKEVYDQYFKNLKSRKDSFVNAKYSAKQFEDDANRLAKYYFEALELSEALKTKTNSEVKAYVDSLKSQGDSIFKVENGVTTVNVLEINSLFNKLNLQNSKNVEEKQPKPEPETKSASESGKDSSSKEGTPSSNTDPSTESSGDDKSIDVGTNSMSSKESEGSPDMKNSSEKEKVMKTDKDPMENSRTQGMSGENGVSTTGTNPDSMSQESTTQPSFVKNLTQGLKRLISLIPGLGWLTSK
ncbi:hypothetical protein [Mycoplasmopsis citelli]|nr:hypothetical protein [Mycoplasmopsis citelli]